MRIDNREFDELRPVKITRNYLLHPFGSVLIEMGNTKVICTAMVDERVPPFLKGTNSGWVTAEYSMLPGSTITRKVRDSTRGRIDGRNQDIDEVLFDLKNARHIKYTIGAVTDSAARRK